MKSTRKLSLKRERLTELSADQLDGLAGGLATGGTAIAIRTSIPITACACTTDSSCVSLDSQCVETWRNVCGDHAIAIRTA